MWTVYAEGELVDLIDDRELAAIMAEAASGEHLQINVVVDLLRHVAIIE